MFHRMYIITQSLHQMSNIFWYFYYFSQHLFVFIVQERRLTEIEKMFNVLLGSLEKGFLWEFVGDWLEKSMEEPTHENFNEFARVCVSRLFMSYYVLTGCVVLFEDL